MDWLFLDRNDERLPLAGAVLVVSAALLLGCWNAWQTIQNQWTASVTSAPIATEERSVGAVNSEAAQRHQASSEPGQSERPVSSGDPYFTVSADEPPLPAGSGLSITPSYSAAGEFEGYLVQGRSGDYRFNHGDIITAINQTPVEDSAAGSELLLIALAQPNIALATRAQSSR